jgi:hypothetical protein
MRWQSLWGIPTSTGINVLPIPIYLLSIIGRTFQQIGARVSVAARLELKPNASGRTILQMNVFLSVLVATLGLGDVVADDDVYPLPLASFVFSSGSASYYLSPYIHFVSRGGVQYSQRINKSGYYSILVSARLDDNLGLPSPIALFIDGLPQGHGPDPASGSDYVWDVNGRKLVEYSADNVYLYAGIHTVGLWCLACSASTATALVSAVSLVMTSSAAPPLEPIGSRDPTVQPFRSYNIWNTAIGSGAVWSKPDDLDTQAIINSASGATINSGCWSVPVYVAKSGDPVGYFAAPTNNVMPISSGYYTQLPVEVVPACGTDAGISLYDPPHRYIQEFLSCSPISAPARGYQCYDNLRTDVCEGQNPTGTFTSWTPGLIRVSEIQRGLILHMLAYAMPTTMTKPPAKWWQVAWPEFQVDECAPTCYSGLVPPGSTIGIPSTVDISTLGLTRSGLALATALQNYGAIQRATGGSSRQGIILYAEQAAESETPVELEAMRSDFTKIQPLLRIMRNQASDNVNGGGQPLKPMQPRIDPNICP